MASAIEQSVVSPAAPLPDSLPPLMAELTQMRQQLGDAKSELSEAIERAAAAAAEAPPPVVIAPQASEADEQIAVRLAEIERGRAELESELELVRTRATELQEVVNQQRRELVEQRADITTELRLLRELVEARREQPAAEFEREDEALVGASLRG